MEKKLFQPSKLLTASITVIAVLAILFFGYQVIQENGRKPTDNPYEYSVKPYDQIDKNLFSHTEDPAIPIELPEIRSLALMASPIARLLPPRLPHAAP